MYNDFMVSDQLQFGCKKNNSCVHALFTDNESVKYFTKRIKGVLWLLDASKAFDKVLHHGILKKLLDKMCL